MRILETRDFFGVAHAKLETDCNYAIIAGKNGAGKSHFLASMAFKLTPVPSNFLYNELGVPYDGQGAYSKASITVNPLLDRVVYYPAQRDIGAASRGTAFAAAGGSQWFHPNGSGLSYDVNARIINAHQRLVSLAVAGNLAEPHSTSDDRAHWVQVVQAFERLTGKSLSFTFSGEKGGKVGLKLGPDASSEFFTLSSGEKEILSIFLDFSLCASKTLFVLDEVELHLHPSLQSSLVEELIRLTPKDSFTLISTHSPAVLLTRGLESVWWMIPPNEAKGQNQLTPVRKNLTIVRTIFDLYSGCSVQPTVNDLLVLAQDQTLASYLEQCMSESEVAPGSDVKDSDPQVSSIRSSVQLVLAKKDRLRFLDFGSGEARCLAAFKSFSIGERKKTDVILIDRDQERLNAATARVPFLGDFGSVKIGSEAPGDGTVDYVVAANVLHEIVGNDFVMCFERLWRSLVSDGILHIVEVTELVKGETSFLCLPPDAYREFFKRLGIYPSISEHLSYGGLTLVDIVVAKKNVELDLPNIREAYRLSLKKAVDLTLDKLTTAVGGARAFHLENLASIERTLRGTSEASYLDK